MKRFLVFLAIAGLVAPARSQFFNGPMIPTTPPASMNLGAGIPTALANPANSNGGVTLLGGPAAQGNCLAWGANGIQDAGSPCLTAPTMGATNISGAGAPVATSLANRATDSGVTFNLKNDFGAKCDGSTDDTTAIQNWLNKAAVNVHLVAPVGTCNFSAPLSIGAVGHYTVEGAGAPATTFQYVGTSPMSATATAAASWTGGSLSGPTWTGGATSLTLSAAAPTFISTMLGYGAVVSVWDTSNTTFTTPAFVGYAASVSGSTVTLKYGASWGSVGSSDNLLFTADLLTLNPTLASNIDGVTLKGFRITSSTPLTGGFALHQLYTWDSRLDDIMLGGVDINDAGDLCGGYWDDGDSGIHWELPRISAKQACGDAILANAAPWRGQIATAELILHDGTIGGDWQGGLLSGIHYGGGMGGFRCDGTDIANDARGVVIENSVEPINNREFVVASSCALDTMSDAAVLLNDQYANGGNADIAGWEASTQTGHGIVVEKWTNGSVEIRGDKIYNNCGSGIYIEDNSAHINVDPATTINNNGYAAVSSACPAWQTANPGHGYGIEASVATTGVAIASYPYGNTAGSYNSNVGGALNLGTSDTSSTDVLGALTVTDTGSGDAANIFINETNGGAGGKASSLFFEDNGTAKWQLNKNASNNFSIIDAANSYTSALSIATPGNVGIGEVVSNVLTVTGALQYTANLPAISSCGTSPPPASAGSSSNGGQFTLGTGTPTACTVTFATAFTHYAYCAVTPASAYTGTYYVSVSSKSAFTVTLGTGTASVVFNYACTGD